MSVRPTYVDQHGISPDQFKMIMDIYATITGEPWFVKEEERRREFAANMLRMYRQGLVVPDKLHAFCLAMTRRHFMEALEPSGTDPKVPR